MAIKFKPAKQEASDVIWLNDRNFTYVARASYHAPGFVTVSHDYSYLDNRACVSNKASVSDFIAHYKDVLAALEAIEAHDKAIAEAKTHTLLVLTEVE